MYENVETLVDVTADVNYIAQGEHLNIARVYRWCWDIYLDNLIADLDGAEQKGQSILEIKVITHYQAYVYMKRAFKDQTK